MALDDDCLMLRIQQHDQNAFSHLVDRHLIALHGFAQRMLGNPMDAEDIIQETFIRVWQKANLWQPKSAKVTTWLHQIVYHLCIDHQRRQKNTLVDITTVELIAPQQPSTDCQQSKVVIQVKAALQKLPDNQRSALILSHYQEMPYQQVAAVLGISLAAVESLITRARRNLRKSLQSQLEHLLGEVE